MAGAPRLDAGDRVLHDDRRDGFGLEALRRLQESIGRRLALEPRRVISIPSTRASNSGAIPAASSTAAQLLLEDTTAVLISCARSVRTSAIAAS